jgi:hypothetical protein
MTRRVALLLIATTLAAGVPGCVSGPMRTSDVGKTATTVDPVTATPRHWWEKPATATVTAGNYDRLWAACDAAIRSFRFIPDVQNYRQGIMTSKPLLSRGGAEFWRNDVLDGDDLAHSTLATYRRTIRYEITETDAGRFVLAIKVLVERSSTFERRVTTGIQYREAFGARTPGTEFRSDDGAEQPVQYWYATGRDTTLESALADEIRERLKS